MPNGGSDCCGTCCFNSKNDGEPGYHGSKKPGKVRCIIRGIEPDDPFYTYCVNHPHHNTSRIAVPLGPVYISEDREIWLLPPKSEEITLQYLQLLDLITNEVQTRYPSPTDLEEIVINQLKELKEERAIPGLLKIVGMDISIFQDYDQKEHFIIRNKANIVGCAIETLLDISEGKYLDKVDFFVDKGLEKFDSKKYDHTHDNFAVIRYHLISGLKYCSQKETEDLLDVAKNDPNESVRKLAGELISKIQSQLSYLRSAYGRRRGTAIVETEQGVIVVTHSNNFFLLPGGGPKRGELQIQAAIRELMEETGLKAFDVRYLFTHMKAKVFLIQAEGDPKPRNEIKKLEYYHKDSSVNVSNNTRLIIEKYWDYKRLSKL